MLIIDFLQKNAEEYENEVCLVEINPELEDKQKYTWKDFSLVEAFPTSESRREMTWANFNDQANQFANFLLEKGVKKGEKVAILLMNCLEWLPIYFGILKTGALAVPLNYRYTAEEIKYCINLADCTCLVFGNEFIGRVESICDSLPELLEGLLYVGDNCPVFAESYEDKTADCSKINPDIKMTEDDFAAIYFSSGTTGFPKAILHNHKSLVCACITEQNHHSQSRDDNFLCVPPLYHTGAKMHWFGSLIAQSKSVLLKGITPELILSTASEEKCTIVWLLVPWAQDILDAIESGRIDLNNYDLSNWRLMHIGAQPVPPSLVQRWKKVFPSHQYDTNYGLSESIGPGCVHLGVENIHKVGAIGKAGFNWKTKIVDTNKNEVAKGEVGELAVSGDGVMICYYKDEDATNSVLQDGWLFTGDMAKEDEDGFIFLVDRKKDVIITGGENIYPVQIEDFLRNNKAIRDVAVIGLQDDRLGEITAAIIELKPEYEGSVTVDDINKFAEGLPRYKRPREIIFDKIPRNPTGKIEKPKLREKYCGGSLVEKQITN